MPKQKTPVVDGQAFHAAGPVGREVDVSALTIWRWGVGGIRLPDGSRRKLKAFKFGHRMCCIGSPTSWSWRASSRKHTPPASSIAVNRRSQPHERAGSGDTLGVHLLSRLIRRHPRGRDAPTDPPSSRFALATKKASDRGKRRLARKTVDVSQPAHDLNVPRPTGVVGFADTVARTTQRVPTRSERERIRRANGGRGVRVTRHRASWSRLIVEQPRERAILALQRLYGNDPTSAVFTVDVALDLVCTTVADAHALRRWLVDRIMWPRGRGHLVEIGASAYIIPGRHRARGLICYSDRSSKIAKRPCLHVEVRHRGRGPCRREGFRQPVDVLARDLQELVTDAIDLREIDDALLGRAWLRRVSRVRGVDRECAARAGRHFRAISHASEEPTATHVAQFARELRMPLRFLRRINVRDILAAVSPQIG